jgi:hypothetical protein
LPRWLSGQQQAEGVDADMVLADGDLLARVDALAICRNVGRGLDTPRTEDACVNPLELWSPPYAASPMVRLAQYSFS